MVAGMPHAVVHQPKNTNPHVNSIIRIRMRLCQKWASAGHGPPQTHRTGQSDAKNAPRSPVPNTVETTIGFEQQRCHLFPSLMVNCGLCFWLANVTDSYA